LPTLSLTALAKDWLPNTKSDVYYFFFAAFFLAGFAFVAFFFVAILGLLNGPFGWRPLASGSPRSSSRPRYENDSTNPSYTILRGECTCSLEAIVDSLSESGARNRRHGDRLVTLIERSQHGEEIRRGLFEVTANRKVERR
jgi:hypothetical protein